MKILGEMVIKPAILKAVSQCMAKQDVRNYLMGVFVDVENNAIVASDGHTMIIAKAKDEFPKSIFEVVSGNFSNFVIDGKVIKTELDSTACKQNAIIVKSLDDDKFMLGNTLYDKVFGKYPDYKRVIPVAPIDNENVIIPKLDLELLNRWGKAQKYVGIKPQILQLDFLNYAKKGVTQTIDCGEYTLKFVIMPVFDKK